MMKKTLIATATAGLIATGAMIGTTSTASAAVYFGGPGWSIGIGAPNWQRERPHRVCTPVFRTERWRDYWGRMHQRRVVVRQECHWTYGRRDGWQNHRWDHRWDRRWH